MITYHRFSSPSIAIVGAGYVGCGMQKIFPGAVMIDRDPDRGHPYISVADDYDLAIVCVPTPSAKDGSCDTSIVEQVVRELKSKLILIKSTVTPGTSDKLARETGKKIVFSPEYMGEWSYWTPQELPQATDPISHGFMILGGDKDDCSAVVDIFSPVLGPHTRYRFMSHTEAELVKYCTNAFLATKVAFTNEVRNICNAIGANYHNVREGWLDDPRISTSHSLAFVTNPGFSGKCFPKDVAALAAFAKSVDNRFELMETLSRVNTEKLKD